MHPVIGADQPAAFAVSMSWNAAVAPRSAARSFRTAAPSAWLAAAGCWKSAVASVVVDSPQPQRGAITARSRAVRLMEASRGVGLFGTHAQPAARRLAAPVARN